MFGSLKKLFGREETPPPPAATPVSKQEPPPSRPSPAPSAALSAAASAAPPPASAQPEIPEERIAISFQAVAAKFPPNVAAAVLSPGKEVSLPLKKVLALLPTGLVKIPFGEIRRHARPGTFSQEAGNDDTLVEIPLPELIAKLGPGQLARRTPKKILDAPPEVTPLFGAHGESLPQPKPAATQTPVAPKPPVPSTPVAETPKAPTPTAIPAPTPIVSTPPVSKAPTPPPAPAPAPRIAAPNIPLPDAPKKPELPKATAPIPAPSIPLPPSLPKPPAPKPSVAPAPASPPAAAAPVPETASSAENFVVVAIADVSAAWPNPVKLEIEQDNLGTASIQLPMDKVEQAMRAGKIIFPWSLVRSWMSPAAPAVPSPSADLLVELPLPVVAPRFLSQHRPTKVQKKIQVGENIPNLFSGAPAAPPPPPAEPAPAPAIPLTPVAAPTPAAPIPAPTAVVPPAPVQPPPPPTPRPVPTPLGLLFGQPDKREWSPAEIVQKTCTLKSVAGAVISTSDGLSVAGQVGAPLSADTVAAFMPQIFSRLSQSTQEMQLGELKRVSLELEKAQCQIFKCGRVYFAILGRAGESLPAVELKTVAMALEKQNQ